MLTAELVLLTREEADLVDAYRRYREAHGTILAEALHQQMGELRAYDAKVARQQALQDLKEFLPL